ncbi:coiled-coil domain-containing protein 171-like isoform X2 [Boleophthalmus pectinirostris]|uniref:coiled-coil domain-containing protein 171-like isoform X2 n=1 Tax=Boleophthalmus pectinirostris TaxID=150288 RepID=UPI0024322840|nr:coiled-coil domain-containing protein 171-like isoform X2 [Boleophthalmus pectinirostris]
MPGEAAGRGRECGRGRRTESGRSSTQPRGTEQRSKSSGEVTRLKEVLLSRCGSDKQNGEMKRDSNTEERKTKEKRGGLKGEAEEDVFRELRWRMNRLENEKLQLTSAHNQQVCSLEAELARLRAAVERGEAERAELQFQITVCLREKEKEAQTNRDLQRERDTLTDRQAELEQSLSDLRVALDRTLRGREQDQRSLQQDVEERDGLIQRLSQDNSQLHTLLTDQKQVLEQSEQRMKELQKEMEKEQEVKRRHAEKVRYLSDREKRLRADKEFAEQRIKTLETNIEAERAAHLESKFNSEIVQLRLRDLEAVLAVEQSNLQEATCSVEQLKEHIHEAEKKREQEQQRSSQTLAQLHRMQLEFEQCKSDLITALETEKRSASELNVALEAEKHMTSCLKEQLEDERRLQESTASQLQKLTENANSFKTFVQDVKETLQQHLEEDSGNWNPDEMVEKLKIMLHSQKLRQEEAKKQIEDLLFASEQLLDDNQALKNLSSQQKTQIQESEQLLEELKQEVSRLQTEGCDWANVSRQLQAELQRERDERKRERDKMEEQLHGVKLHQHEQEEARVSSLHSLLQRLQPQSIMETLSWDELWIRVNDRVEEINADFHQAKHQVSSLQSVLSRLEDKVRRREADLSRKHQNTVTELQHHLQSSRSDCRSLQDHVTSLTSDLSSLCDQSGRFQWACLLLGGALSYTQTRLQRLSEQKAYLCRRLAEHDALEQEVRSLVEALEANEDDTQQQKKKRARRRWRRVLNVVMALRKWCMLGKTSCVLFRVQVGETSAVGMSLCGETTARKEGQNGTESREMCLTQWLRSKGLSTVVLSSMADLQRALSGSSPQNVLSAVQSGLSRLLDHLLDQSDAATVTSKHNCPMRQPTMQPHMKELVSSLQQHFLDFSQRLHSTEVERRNLRLELNNLRRAAKKREQEANKMVSSEQFDAVCSELQGALCREQETQALMKELNSQLNTLRNNMESLNTQKTKAQEAHDHTAQLLSHARREVSRKERSLRILGKHLSVVQKEKRQLEERLRDTQDQLQNNTKRKEQLIEMMRSAERSCTQFRESLVQSHRPLCSKPHPLTFSEIPTGTESIMGDPGVAACQSLLTSVALLSQTFSSRADWLEQEISAHQSHVTALRSELQDACLRHNLVFTPLEIESAQLGPGDDLLKNVAII